MSILLPKQKKDTMIPVTGPELEDQVVSVTVLDESRAGSPTWFQVQLEKQAEPFALHINWFQDHALEVGDGVRFVVSNCKFNPESGQGIDKEGYLMFERLRVIPKGTIEVTPQL